MQEDEWQELPFEMQPYDEERWLELINLEGKKDSNGISVLTPEQKIEDYQLYRASESNEIRLGCQKGNIMPIKLEFAVNAESRYRVTTHARVWYIRQAMYDHIWIFDEAETMIYDTHPGGPLWEPEGREKTVESIIEYYKYELGTSDPRDFLQEDEELDQRYLAEKKQNLSEAEFAYWQKHHASDDGDLLKDLFAGHNIPITKFTFEDHQHLDNFTALLKTPKKSLRLSRVRGNYTLEAKGLFGYRQLFKRWWGFINKADRVPRFLPLDELLRLLSSYLKYSPSAIKNQLPPQLITEMQEYEWEELTLEMQPYDLERWLELIELGDKKDSNGVSIATPEQKAEKHQLYRNRSENKVRLGCQKGNILPIKLECATHAEGLYRVTTQTMAWYIKHGKIHHAWIFDEAGRVIYDTRPNSRRREFGGILSFVEDIIEYYKYALGTSDPRDFLQEDEELDQRYLAEKKQNLSEAEFAYWQKHHASDDGDLLKDLFAGHNIPITKFTFEDHQHLDNFTALIKTPKKSLRLSRVRGNYTLEAKGLFGYRQRFKHWWGFASNADRVPRYLPLNKLLSLLKTDLKYD